MTLVSSPGLQNESSNRDRNIRGKKVVGESSVLYLDVMGLGYPLDGWTWSAQEGSRS